VSKSTQRNGLLRANVPRPGALALGVSVSGAATTAALPRVPGVALPGALSDHGVTGITTISLLELEGRVPPWVIRPHPARSVPRNHPTSTFLSRHCELRATPWNQN
jgi:hypothetical protein